ncbi:MAG: hypothetical protein Q7U18_13695 [Methylobacter sp.]|nr:hypothetical protein [Methylobacter sp.]
MKNKIEIYLRHSIGKVMLNLYVPKETKKRFLTGLKNGALELPEDSANFELSILPEWITDPEQRERIKNIGETIHVCIPIAAINTMYTD